MNKEILKKYLSDKSNLEEFNVLVKWLSAKEDGEESRSWFLEDWESTYCDEQDLNPLIFSALLDEIHYKIKLENLSEEIKKLKFRKLSPWFNGLALCLFLPLYEANFFY